ncbi:MAG: UvrD-helicase domain-containing protein [bacterium]|nr:UvrD-helicase domain-containing protein [bacterium]
MDFLQGLNPHQQEAVSHADGPLLILAGAGSGKTRVITHRICHLLRSRDVPGWAILAVTFTNKAADEMRARVAQMLGGGEYKPPVISTFHSFCVRLLRRDGASLAEVRPGFTTRFLIYDEDDQLATIKRAYKAIGADAKFMPYRTALSRISRAKNRKEGPRDFHEQAKDPDSRKLASIFERYEDALRSANALDFDDLLLEAVRLLVHDQAVRDSYNNRLRYLMVDEYQDTNRSQYEMMRLLSEKHRNVCVVGDEDQSIYSWRGADIRNILDFEQDYPDARTIRLEQNYRSTKNILSAAGAVVERNRDRLGKQLWTDAGAGEMIGLYEAPDSQREAWFIADTIEQLLSDDPKARVAVLYRTNAQSRPIEEALRRNSRDYIVIGGLSFYQRAEIKDVLAYLKLLLSPHDPVSLHRVINKPARGIGRSSVDQIERHSREHRCSLWQAICSLLDEELLPTRSRSAFGAFRNLIEGLREAVETDPVGDVVGRIVDESGYRDMLTRSATPEAESRLENLDELINAAGDAANRGEDAAQFLDSAALVADVDSADLRAKVSLLTMHNAKGLEWPVVFLAGLEDGLFPHIRSLEAEHLMEEERRLCYVGMTRAEQRLFLSWARQRRRFGGGPLETQSPSRFLKEVPSDYIAQVERERDTPEMDLFTERHDVRETARKNTYTGKTYNSVENIAQFFRERGMTPPAPEKPTGRKAEVIPLPQKTAAPKPRRRRRGLRAGTTVEHPRFGKGMLLRQEGEGDNAKLTVSFPGHGLKKLVAKYANLKVEE